jgi:hypothetical protein
MVKATKIDPVKNIIHWVAAGLTAGYVHDFIPKETQNVPAVLE